jgi:L-fucose isomerase-like protein
MKDNKKITIGYAPTRRNVFSVEEAKKYKKIILDKIKKYGFDIVDIEGINEDGLLVTESDVESTIKKFRENKVDCIFSPHCNFGTESAVAMVAQKINKPFLLWGPRDEAPLSNGSRLRDTQCGLFATSKILQRYGIPFTYIINSNIEDKVFERGFLNFIKAVNVVKKFKDLKIGQIGVRPGDFWTVMCNEGELLEKFGIRLVPFNLGDIVSKVKDLVKNPSKEFEETIKDVKNKVDIRINDAAFKNLIALKVVIKEISLNQDIPAFALQCWTSLQDMLGIMPCFAHGLLFDDKIPVACETDIHGAISSIITQAASLDEKSIFFADLTIRHPEDDNSELLWHCGPFPLSLKKEGVEAFVSNHLILDGGCPGTGNWEIKGGDISLVRFDGFNGKYNLFVGHAKGTTGPWNSGTYLWIKVNDWSKWEEKLIYGPYIHHVTGVHDKIAPVLFEAVKYIKNLQLDTIDPTIEEIKDWLACRI